jgi:hypothetical protein
MLSESKRTGVAEGLFTMGAGSWRGKLRSPARKGVAARQPPMSSSAHTRHRNGLDRRTSERSRQEANLGSPRAQSVPSFAGRLIEEPRPNGKIRQQSRHFRQFAKTDGKFGLSGS